VQPYFQIATIQTLYEFKLVIVSWQAYAGVRTLVYQERSSTCVNIVRLDRSATTARFQWQLCNKVKQAYAGTNCWPWEEPRGHHQMVEGLGQVVNKSKTKLCMFHRLDHPQITIRFFNWEIRSNNSMNVLGVTFNCKLQLSAQVSNAIVKANHALCTIKIIKKHLTKIELCTFLIWNFFFNLVLYT
jgi:hypothetical protein